MTIPKPDKKANIRLWRKVELEDQKYTWYVGALKNKDIFYWDFNSAIFGFKTSIRAYLEENIDKAKSMVKVCGQKIVKDQIIDGIYYCETD